MNVITLDTNISSTGFMEFISNPFRNIWGQYIDKEMVSFMQELSNDMMRYYPKDYPAVFYFVTQFDNTAAKNAVMNGFRIENKIMPTVFPSIVYSKSFSSEKIAYLKSYDRWFDFFRSNRNAKSLYSPDIIVSRTAEQAYADVEMMDEKSDANEVRSLIIYDNLDDVIKNEFAEPILRARMQNGTDH